MDELFRYLQTLIEKNGPDPEDYADLDAWIERVIDNIRKGVYGEKELRALRALWGDALSVHTCQGFAYQKPHGYAGDFEMMDRLYTEYRSPDPRLAKWDAYTHRHESVRAVRNRPSYLLKLIESHVRTKKAITVLNVGSGPGRDMRYCFDRLNVNGRSRMTFHCVEHDDRAVAHAREVCRPYLKHIFFRQDNILRYRPTGAYDLIWASGIFDYFNDRLFVHVLKKLLAVLAPDGECVVGNLSAANATRNYLELMEWRLHYRTPVDLRRLAETAGTAPDRILVGNDETGANLFLHVTRA